MTAATVAAELARLDAVSRQRALDERESRQLERLMTSLRRYRRSRPREPVARAERTYTVVARDGIIARIDATLALMKQEGRRIRAIYLTTLDMAGAEASGRLSTGAVTFRGKLGEGIVYAGQPVRWCKGRHSVVHDTCGVPLAIRQRVTR